MELYLTITKSQLTIMDLMTWLSADTAGRSVSSAGVFDQWTACEQRVYSKQSPVKPKCFLLSSLSSCSLLYGGEGKCQECATRKQCADFECESQWQMAVACSSGPDGFNIPFHMKHIQSCLFHGAYLCFWYVVVMKTFVLPWVLCIILL